MRKTSVELKRAITVPSEEGITVTQSEYSQTLKGLLLPSDTILGSYPHSYMENCAYCFFCKQKHPDIKAGNIICANGVDYIIVHVSEYRKIRIIYIANTVNAKGRQSFFGSLRY